MMQNPCKTLGYKKIWSTKFPLGVGGVGWGGGGLGVNHIQPVAYYFCWVLSIMSLLLFF